MNIPNEYQQYIESILGFTTDLEVDEIIEVLNEVHISIDDKKKCEMIKKYLEDLKFLRSKNIEIYRENRNKILMSNIKLDNKTRFSNPVVNDKLSPTIHAFYYSDKSRQRLSDKEAAALKTMNLEKKFEIIDDECMLAQSKRYGKDFDQDSNCSNGSNPQLSFNNSSFNGDSKCLNKKRKNSMKTNSNNKRIGKKMQRTSNRNPYENINNENYNNNKNNYLTYNNSNNYHSNTNGFSEYNNNQDDEEDKDYCITTCLLGRKYQVANDLMIGCDNCENWYHPKCIKMTDEEFEIVKNSEWKCYDCKNNR